MEVISLGDCALIVRVSGQLDTDPARASERVLTTLRRLEAADLPGVVELSSAYTTVAVVYDPVRVIEAGAPMEAVDAWLADRIRAAADIDTETVGKTIEPRHVVIPICYGSEYGPDLEEVARHSGLSADDVVRRHSAPEYVVHCIGFSPGFPYLGGLPPELAMPRRATPRKSVPAGSVGIGGAQTGIYPQSSPGGWHLIGRTPMRLFSVDRDPPSMLGAGDRVRFQPITREEFETWEE